MNGRGLIAWNVRRIRVAKGVSQERLAYEAEIDRAYLGGIERKTENPTVDVLDRLAKALGVALAELFSSPGSKLPRMEALRPGRRPSSERAKK